MRSTSGLFGIIVSCSILRSLAHPLCYFDDRSTDYSEVLTFCPEQQSGACCNDDEEAAVEALFQAAGTLSTSCSEYYQQVVCGPCHSYSAHLFERLGGELGAEDGMTMKQEFCEAFVDACAGELEFFTYDGEDYCTKHQGGGDDFFWSYPYTEDEVFESELSDYFSTSLPSLPIAMHMSPDGSVWWVGGQDGQIFEIDAASLSSGSTVLDLSAISEFYVSYEHGLLDFAFGPAFHSNNRFYISYSATDSAGDVYNRLSRFDYSGSASATLASEELLIETSLKSTLIHAGGWCGFKPSDYDSSSDSHDLYWSIGDSGPQEDTDDHGQNPDDFHATIVRISVPTTGTGYTIPSGNYVGGLPEICAYGFRNPFRCGFDSQTDELYCGDVGHTMIESVDIVECGMNYGWSRFEGSRCFDATEDRFGPCDGASRSDFTFPIFEYCHPDYYSDIDSEDVYTEGVDICGDRTITGFAIIGGYVYRGNYFSDVLGGTYIFGDNQNKNIYYIKEQDGVWQVGTIVSDGSLPVVSFAEDNEGELYILTSDENIYAMPCGDLCTSDEGAASAGVTTSILEDAASVSPDSASTTEDSLLTCLEQADEEPTYQSVGCFADVADDRALTLQAGPLCDAEERAMSATICASYCSTIEGATLFGLEFSFECFCGSASDAYDKHGDLTDDMCSQSCTSFPEESCGGYLAIEVFALGTVDS